MNEKVAKKGGGGKLNRTQMVTLRLDPRLRYLTDLAARIQRRTTSGFIEWAIEEAIGKLEMLVDEENNRVYTLADESFWLWDVDEPDRLVKLAERHPNLLTHDEQLLWKVITEAQFLYNKDYIDPTGAPRVIRLDVRLVRKYWSELQSVANKEMGIADLAKRFNEEENG